VRAGNISRFKEVFETYADRFQQKKLGHLLFVVSCFDSGNDLFIIQMKEVESDYPLLGSSRGKNSSPQENNTREINRREDSISAFNLI
ncbi:unnamed protein product, partial [Adineta steineri]